MFRIEVSFKSLVGGRDKFFGIYNPGIRKIARAVSESIASAEFKLPPALLFKNPVANYYLGFALLRPVYRPGFINISAIPSDAAMERGSKLE